MELGKVVRIAPLRSLLKLNSLLLLGPRQTGKSTLIRQAVGNECVYYDLLDTKVFAEISHRPWLIREQLSPEQRLIVIDEIQKVPSLLDEVHLMVARDPGIRFLLSGSSARKLNRHERVNMTGGRVWETELHPFVSPELDFAHWEERISIGSIPGIMASNEPFRALQAYAGFYLREEIAAEGLVRSIQNFARFLETAAQTNGEQLNFANVASDSTVPSRTVREYYQILVDTLVGFYLAPWGHGKRKAVATPKFYFFDVGVANSLVGRREVPRGTPEYGRTFEHLVICEVRAYLSYRGLKHAMTYWRTREKHEVDLIIGDEYAIEIKGKPMVTDRDLKNIRLIGPEANWRKRIVVCEERLWRRTEDGIEVFPVEQFLRRLWNDELIGAERDELQLPARRVDVAPAGLAHEAGNRALDDGAEGIDALGRGHFKGNAGARVQRDQVHLAAEAAE
jgi:predicted AAA+ superfamily ATPase